LIVHSGVGIRRQTAIKQRNKNDIRTARSNENNGFCPVNNLKNLVISINLGEYARTRHARADLHGATLSHALSLRQPATDMT